MSHKIFLAILSLHFFDLRELKENHHMVVIQVTQKLLFLANTGIVFLNEILAKHNNNCLFFLHFFLFNTRQSLLSIRYRLEPLNWGQERCSFFFSIQPSFLEFLHGSDSLRYLSLDSFSIVILRFPVFQHCCRFLAQPQLSLRKDLFVFQRLA